MLHQTKTRILAVGLVAIIASVAIFTQLPANRIANAAITCPTGGTSTQVDCHRTSGNDLMYGDNLKNRIIGYGGDDTIYGYGDNDIIMGREGADIMSGGSGNDGIYQNEPNHNFRDYATDRITGGSGTDECAFRTADGDWEYVPSSGQNCETYIFIES